MMKVNHGLSDVRQSYDAAVVMDTVDSMDEAKRLEEQVKLSESGKSRQSKAE